MPVLIFFGALLLIFIIGILPIINLVLLSSCKSRIEDLMLRIRALEKAVEKGQPASPSKPGVKIQVPGTAETKTVPGFLLSNQPAANPPQKPAGIKPEVKPETPAPLYIISRVLQQSPFARMGHKTRRSKRGRTAVEKRKSYATVTCAFFD